MNDIYLYNGSFEELIALIASLIYLKIEKPLIKNIEDYEYNLLSNPINLKLSNKESITKYFKKHLSYQILHSAYLVFLSINKNKEIIIFYFLKNALIYKEEIYYHRNINAVNQALIISQRVRRENHKLKGFLRFKEMKNNFYYAEMAPTNDIITILTPHFVKRLKHECFLIKDTKRKIYAFYDGKNVSYLEEKDIIKLDIKISLNEEKIETLWKTFFQTIAIKERKNLKNQQSLMPKKYWNYIIEMENSNEETDKR